MEDNLTDTPHSNPESSPAPPSQPPNSLFFGRFGLRAGWGMLIFFAVSFGMLILGQFAALAATGQLRAMIAAKQTGGTFHVELVPALAIVNDGLPFFGMLALCWLFARGEHRRISSYGLGRARVSDFLPGAFWGLATLSLLVFILHSLHLLVFDARLLNGSAILAYGIKWLLAFLFVGFSEEYLLRGYLQYTLTRGLYGIGESESPHNARAIAFWGAAVLMSILFSAGHLGNAHENPMGLIMVFVAGMVFSYALWRTGSLWWSVGFHMAWDWAQSFLYGVPDSGQISLGRLFQTHPVGNRFLSGDIDGPEGSVYVIPVMLLVVAIIRFTTKPGVQPPLEQETVHSGPATLA